MTVTEIQDKTENDQRRSQRIVLSVGVTVQGACADGWPIHEVTRTLVVNAHGALLPLESPVTLGQVLSIRHNKTDEQLHFRVARIERGSCGNAHIGIEFLEPSARFWRITFPPMDWRPAEPDAPHVAAPQLGLAPVEQAA